MISQPVNDSEMPFAIPTQKTESISKDELEYFEVAKRQLDGAQTALQTFVNHLAQKYRLGMNDQIDGKTGEIRRQNVEPTKTE
jgi:hypothetical protein